MANNISNHFTITALADGVTINGSLRISGTLSQNYNSGTQQCVPDWKNNVSLRPVVYAVIHKGSAYINATQIVGGQWLYNDVPIQFGLDKKSTNCLDSAGDPLFEMGTTNVPLGGATYTVPCLTIISNLAGPTNLDLDTIGYSGAVEIAGKQADFHAQVDVKIAQMTTQGFLGLISPESAIISEKGQSVTLTALLYAEDGSTPASFYTKWYDGGSGAEFSAARGQHTFSVNERDVVDNLVVRCDFYTDSAYTNRVATAFASIDDTQDPEFLYVSMNGTNSDYSGQLAPGESVEVSMWVATMDDSTAINVGYNTFAIRYYNGNQDEITAGLPAMSITNHVAKITIPYDFVAANGYKINGIVTAS